MEVSNCTHGDIRLTGKAKSTGGRVEICIHRVWGAVCDDGWDARDANVVSGQLGYFPFGKSILFRFPLFILAQIIFLQCRSNSSFWGILWRKF